MTSRACARSSVPVRPDVVARVVSAMEARRTFHERVLGPVEVERWLYKDRADPTAHALAALDLRLGIIEGFWTTRAR